MKEITEQPLPVNGSNPYLSSRGIDGNFFFHEAVGLNGLKTPGRKVY